MNLITDQKGRTKKQGSVLLAATLIAGICVGVSYFTLPITTGISGFLPALFMTLVVWLFSMCIGLLYAEATLGQPDGANLISIARNLLGKAWMIPLACVFFINMFAYLTSYQFFATRFIVWVFFYAFDAYVPETLAGLINTVFFGGVVCLGMFFTCRVNFILVVGLLTAFAFTLFHGSEHVLTSRLTHNNWAFIFFAVPLIYSSLGYAAIMPSICTYLKRDVKKIRLSVFLGTLIPVIFFILWQWFMIGSISRGAYWVLYEQNISLAESFSLLNHFPSLAYVLNFTIFFSVITSTLGNGTVLLDFLSDGFKLPPEKRKGLKRFGISCLVFIPPLICSIIAGYFFLNVIQYFTAPIGEILINGIIPVWMVAQARYAQKLPTPHLLPGGRLTLFILGGAIFILIYLEGVQFIRS